MLCKRPRSVRQGVRVITGLYYSPLVLDDDAGEAVCWGTATYQHIFWGSKPFLQRVGWHESGPKKTTTGDAHEAENKRRLSRFVSSERHMRSITLQCILRP